MHTSATTTNAISLILFILSFAAPQAAQGAGFEWKPNSVLAEGKWVKIEIEKTGITRIPYSQLREMGFSDVRKVGVYGRGGEMLPISFSDTNGLFIQPDDLEQLPAMRTEDALYFYAEGTEKYTFTIDDTYAETRGYFAHGKKNIYSNSAYYFLSETESSENIRSIDPKGLNPQPASAGVGLTHHESDLEQNIFNNGQLFWGEMLGDGEKSLRFPLNLPVCKGNGRGVLDSELYIDATSRKVQLGTLSFGLSGSDDNITMTPGYNTSSNFRPVESTRTEVRLPGNECEIFFSYDGEVIPADYEDEEHHLCGHLDYWSVSYPIDMERLPWFTSRMEYAVVTPERENGEGKVMALSLPTRRPGVMVWDVTDSKRPVAMQYADSHSGHIFATEGRDYTMISMIDPGATDTGIKSWQDVPNQNIHSQAKRGADFAIITLPAFETSARKLAKLHEEKYGQECIVATTGELYNEYSGGTPDVMAYRNFIKMLYDSSDRIRNVLLFGTTRADVRGVKADKGREEYIIAFQSLESTKRDGAMNNNDFLGIMTERIDDNQKMETLPVEIGIGYLPFLNVGEAEMYVDKLERYIEDPDFADFITDHMAIGCEGDTHQHESQCVRLQSHIQAINEGHTFIPVMNDHLGNDAARQSIIQGFNSGAGAVSYIGHGGCFVLTKQNVFRYADISKLHNTKTPFMYFSACNLTNSDMGTRGISEQMVVGVPYGLIGAVTSTRTAWSGPNFELMKSFYSHLYQTSDIKANQQPITVGEAFARAKSEMASSNELSFLLLSDPAIKIPVALRTLSDPEISGKTGETIKFSGKIMDYTGHADTDFNGKLVVKILAPAKTERVAGKVTGNGEGPEITYRHTVLTKSTGEVKNGVYNGSIRIPYIAEYKGSEPLTVQITAYDKERYISAASHNTCDIWFDAQSALQDVTSPWISEISYDDSDGTLSIETCDDTALDISEKFPSDGFSLKIDGRDEESLKWGSMILLPDATRCLRKIPLENLEAGEHIASITVKDASGNEHREDFKFQAGIAAAGKIWAELDLMKEIISFNVEGDRRDGRILIMTMEGRKATELRVTDKKAEISMSELPAGRYRAVFEEDETGLRTETIIVGVI